MSTNEAPSFVPTGSDPAGVTTPQANTFMNAPVVGQQTTEQTHATSLKPRIRTPLVASEWKSALKAACLSDRYPQIYHFITYGADAGINLISSTFTPSNHPSITSNQNIFYEIVTTEFKKGCYWRPFLKAELEDLIGPFQTSPLSLIPKPGKFHLIQNLSYPRNIEGVRSINSSIETDLYPCTWGTFSTIATLTQSLPPGSMGTCRDVAEAY